MEKNKIITQHGIPMKYYIPLLENVAKDIIGMKFNDTMTLRECNNKFYKIMRKYGIKEGTPRFNENGKLISTQRTNFQWTMCRNLYMDTIISYMNMNELFGNSILPKDLKY
jgi:hypothetical protein